MAKPSDVPKEHRAIAEAFKHLESMPAEEARFRAGHIYKLEQRCPTTGELRDITLAYTARLAAALPVGEYMTQIRHLNLLAAEMPGTGINSPAHDCHEAVADLKAENVYAPGLVRACERFLEGQEPLFDECDIGAVTGVRRENQ